MMKALFNFIFVFTASIAVGQVYNPSSTLNTTTNPGTNNVGIGINTPLEKLHINGSIRGNAEGNALRISTGNGYVDIGPVNTSWSHFLTDRAYFYFNKPVTVDGGISSYSTNDLFLQTNNTTRLTVLNANGNVGLGTTIPSARLHIKSDASLPPTIALDKNSSSEEALIQFRKSGNVQFYFYTDNGDDALKIQSTAFADEHDNAPRIQIPFTNKNIYLAQSGGNVGIGTNNPGGRLEINQAGGQLKLTGGTVAGGVWTSAGDQLYLADWNTGTKGLSINMTSGNVSIGTVSSTWKLDVGGWIASNGQAFAYTDATSINIGDVAGGDGLRDKLHFHTRDQKRMTIDENGKVGIGTLTPDEKLTVSGTIHSTRVKVDVTVPGPDYVFEKEYNLLSLEEIKKYIDANKHLPEVPSAREMEKNGIDVAEMNMMLLKKVEELTLHMIELKKENTEMKKEIKALKDKK